MTEKQHPVDRLIRYLAGTPEPPTGSRERVEAALMAEINKTTARPATPRYWLRALTVATAAAALAVLLIVQPFAQSVASATLEEIAEVAALQDPLKVTDTSFVYTQSEATGLGTASRDALGDVPYEFDELYYIISVEREAWIGSEGTRQIRTTFGEPTFFTEEDEQSYYAAGLDVRDEVGETTTSTVSIPLTEWPEDTNELDQAILEIVGEPADVPFDVRYLDVSLGILREAHITPQLRSATITLISRLDSLQYQDLGEGISSFFVDYTILDVEHQLEFHLDEVGNLIFENLQTLAPDPSRRLPAGTSIFQAVYDLPSEADALSTP